MRILFFLSLFMFCAAARADYTAAEDAYKNGRYSEALSGFMQEVESKADRRAQYYVGRIYLEGLGVTQNEKKALKYIQASADQDFDAAQAQLGFLYDEGRVLPLDKKKAVSYYKKAAEQGNTSALLNLGLAYYKGEGVAKSDQTAIEMLEKVPVEQQPSVGRYLGEIYLSNPSLPDRYSKAINAYSASARKGDIASFYALAQIFSRADSGVLDKKRALNFYTYAASKKYVQAQYLLGTMYVNGEEIERNLFLGHAWLEMAASNRYDPAISALKQLEKSMTLSEIEESKKEFMRLQQEVVDKVESPYIVEERIRAEEASKQKTHVVKRPRRR